MRQLLTTTAIALAIPLYYYSQDQSTPAQQGIMPITSKFTEQIDYVYGAGFFTGKPELKDAVVQLLMNRVEFRHEPEVEGEKFPKISTLPLMNKHNSDVTTHDPALFSIESFNPLVYAWDFFSNKTQVFRIDGTEYLLIVKPQ